MTRRLGPKELRNLLLAQTRSPERVERAMRILFDDTARENAQQPPSPALCDAVERYLSTSPFRSEETKKTYASLLRKFVDTVHSADLKLSGLTEAMIDDFLVRALEDRGASRNLKSRNRNGEESSEGDSMSTRKPNTYKRERATLSAFMTWAVRKGLMERNLALETAPPTIKVGAPVALTPQEQARFLALAKKSRRTGTRDHALAFLFLHTGLRVGEMVALKWSDLDFEEGLLYVPDGDGTDRVIPLLPSAASVLRGYRQAYELNDRNSHVFVNCLGQHKGTPMTRDGIEKLYRPIFRQLGKKAGISVHCFRHTFAVNLMWLGVSQVCIQKALGHASPETTLIYQRAADPDVVRELNEKCTDPAVFAATRKGPTHWARALQEAQLLFISGIEAPES